MKSKSKNILRTVFSVFLSVFIFSAFIYGYLYINMKRDESKADTKDYNIPYEAPAPQNTGILFNFESGASTLVFLDFEGERIYMLDLTDDNARAEDYGYPIDFTVNATYDTIKTAVDIAGGIDINLEGEVLRYTGVQVVELLSVTVDTTELRREIFSAVFEQFSKFGVSREDLIELLNSTSCDLSVPHYYRWADYLKIMSRRVSFVN